MSRSAVSVRSVRVEDAPQLQALWAEFSRRPARGGEAVEEVAQAIRLALADDDTRIVVAELAGEFAGAVHLSVRAIGPMSRSSASGPSAPSSRTCAASKGVGTFASDS